MIKKKVLIIALVLYKLTSFGQVINLGTAANFVLFTSTGAVGNTGNSTLTGDIGSDLGAISGFGDATVDGSIYNADTVTALAKADLLSAYAQLISVPPTETTHPPAFGAGETLTAGVYTIAGAGSLAGNLTLDGLGNINSLFIFRFGGAFDTGASSSVILVNGASCCNIFWVSEGAVAMAASTTMKGTIISNNGAVSMADAGDLEGRMLSTTGAVAFGPATAFICEATLPIELISLTGKCNNQNIELKWSTATETNNHYFSIERSIDGINWQLVTEVDGAGNSSSIKKYSYIDVVQYDDISYYRLKQTDFDGGFKYSAIIGIEKCAVDITELAIYPNPANEALNLSYKGDKSQILSTSIYNLLGGMVYYSEFYQSKIVFENKLNGTYFLHLNLASKNSIKKLFVVD
jgi:hypothetical protein